LSERLAERVYIDALAGMDEFLDGIEGLEARIEALERVRLAAQAVANTWRIAEGSPCVTENEAEDALVAALRSEEEKP